MYKFRFPQFGIPDILDPDPQAELIRCTRFCSDCRGTYPGCSDHPDRKIQIEYKRACRNFSLYCQSNNAQKNLSCLQPLQILGLLSKLRFANNFTKAQELSSMWQIRYRIMMRNNVLFTRIPEKLTEYVKQLTSETLSREQWKVIFPRLQDHFPLIPFKFYLLLRKLSLALGFLTRRLCRDRLELCEFIFTRIFRTKLVRSKYSPHLILRYREDPIDASDLLNVFFQLNPEFS